MPRCCSPARKPANPPRRPTPTLPSTFQGTPNTIVYSACRAFREDSLPLPSGASARPHPQSVPAFFARPRLDEVVVQLEGGEPWTAPGFFVDMATKVRVGVGRRRLDREFQLVLAGTGQFDVIAIVRPVIGNHRHQFAFETKAAARLDKLELDDQIGHPVAFGKSVGIVLRCVDVGFQMDVGFFDLLHHAVRVHFDGLQIDGTNLHPFDDLMLADRCFGSMGNARSEEQRKRRGEPFVHVCHSLKGWGAHLMANANRYHTPESVPLPRRPGLPRVCERHSPPAPRPCPHHPPDPVPLPRRPGLPRVCERHCPPAGGACAANPACGPRRHRPASGPCRFSTCGRLRPMVFSLTAVGRSGAQTPQSLCRGPILLAPFDHLPGYRGAPARLLWLLSGRLRRTSSIFTPPISAVLALARSRLKPANS